jgi:YegS/Rv2252/BmrU family lipid kinase
VLEVPYPTAERFLVLINPHASGGQSPVVMRRRIAAAFAEHDVPFDLVTAADPAEALDIARQAARDGVRAIVAAGGDGTVAQALRGAAGTEVPVAILPFGTGNQLANNFDIPASLDGAVRVAVQGRVEEIDLCRAGDEVFALMAGAGLDAELIGAATAERKKSFGPAAYMLGGLKSALTPRSSKFHIVADDQDLEVQASMVLLANVGQLAVSPFPIEIKVAPRVSFHDGLLDVCIFAARNLSDWATMLWRVARERYSGDDRMLFMQAKRVRVEADPPVAVQIDGEASGETPLEAEVIPGAGRILVQP